MNKTRQLNLKDRITIQNYLEDEIPVSIICKKIGVTKQTIYREIKRNSKTYKIQQNRIISNVIDCKNRFTCPFTYDNIQKRHTMCKTKCSNFVKNTCDKIEKFPFICNKCYKKGLCRFEGNI